MAKLAGCAASSLWAETDTCGLRGGKGYGSAMLDNGGMEVEVQRPRCGQRLIDADMWERHVNV